MLDGDGRGTAQMKKAALLIVGVLLAASATIGIEACSDAGPDPGARGGGDADGAGGDGAGGDGGPGDGAVTDGALDDGAKTDR